MRAAAKPVCSGRTRRACRSATWKRIRRRCASSRPGRVYRRDNFDATHTPMFTQVEGLVVDEGISLGDLEGHAGGVCRALLRRQGEHAPSSELLPVYRALGRARRECLNCRGRGCALCKHTGWIEVLGCGMVHPAVFEAVGYDSTRYSGFAFGVGRRTARASSLRHRRHPHVLRERPAIPRAARAMKVPVSWLRDFVPVPDDAAAVAARLGACGFAVESVEGDVVDFEITANRPDCLSMYGMAREASAAFELPLAPLADSPLAVPGGQRPHQRVDCRSRLRPVCARRRPCGGRAVA